MALKFKTLKESNKILNQKNARTLGLSSNRLSRENIRQTELDNKTKNNLILKDNDVINFTSLNYSDNKKFNETVFDEFYNEMMKFVKKPEIVDNEKEIIAILNKKLKELI